MWQQANPEQRGIAGFTLVEALAALAVMGAGLSAIGALASYSRLLKNSFLPQFDSVPDSLGFRCVPGFAHARRTFSPAC